MSETMICRLCPENGPQSLDNFYYFQESPRGDGYQRGGRYDTRCKECTRKYKKSRAKEGPEGASARRAAVDAERKAAKLAREQSWREDLELLLSARTPVEEIAQRMGYQTVNGLYARAKGLGVKMPERLAGTRANAIDPYAPLNRPQAEAFCKRATKWLYKRYAERGYTTDLIAELGGGKVGGSMVRKAAERHGITVDVEFRLTA